MISPDRSSLSLLSIALAMLMSALAANGTMPAQANPPEFPWLPVTDSMYSAPASLVKHRTDSIWSHTTDEFSSDDFDQAFPSLRPNPGSSSAPLDGVWSVMPPPTARYWQSTIYDPLNERVIVFGGYDGQYRNDTWALGLSGPASWRRLSTRSDPPPVRAEHVAVYDPTRHRMVIFGGWNGARLADAWALSLSDPPTWERIDPINGEPLGRSGHAAIYDPVEDRMIVYGGDADDEDRGKTSALEFSGAPRWIELEPAGTPVPGRRGHAAVYDPIRQRMLIFGGWPGTDEVWVLTLGDSLTWDLVDPGSTRPSPRSSPGAFFDAERDRMVVFGGSFGDGGLAPPNDVWALSFQPMPDWDRLDVSGQTIGRYRHGIVYQPNRDRMVVVAGIDADGFLSSSTVSLEFTPSPAWTGLQPSLDPPTSRWGHSAVYDNVRRRMIVFGGAAGAPLNDVWARALDGSQEWTKLAPVGPAPSARFWHSAVYDELADRMIVFGGDDGGYVNDVWALSFSSSDWSLILPNGAPPPSRREHAAIYDPVENRMIVYGGYRGTRLNDIWELRLSGPPEWSQVITSGDLPPDRSGHAAVYDSAAQRMVVFGGDGGYPRKTWALELAGEPVWRELAVVGDPPAQRREYSAVFDPARRRMVVYGGLGGQSDQLRRDSWALSLGPTPTWQRLEMSGELAPRVRSHAAILDRAGDRMIAFGGELGGGPSRNAWIQTWNVLLVENEPALSSLDLRELSSDASSTEILAVPSVFREGTTISVRDVRDGARLAIYDASGRRVRDLSLYRSAQDQLSSSWDGLDDSRRRVPAGLYFVRLTSEHGTITRKILRR